MKKRDCWSAKQNKDRKRHIAELQNRPYMKQTDQADCLLIEQVRHVTERLLISRTDQTWKKERLLVTGQPNRPDMKQADC
jgi:hypothetical protein